MDRFLQRNRLRPIASIIEVKKAFTIRAQYQGYAWRGFIIFLSHTM